MAGRAERLEAIELALALSIAESGEAERLSKKRKGTGQCRSSALAGGPDVSDGEYAAAYAEKYGREPISVHGKLLRNVTSLAVNNNVFTATLKKPVDLLKLQKILAYMGAEYSTRKKFPSLGLHFAADAASSRAAISIFGTGKIVCLGCQSRNAALAIFTKMVDIIEAHFPGTGPPEIRPRNVVGTMALDLTIDLMVLYCHIKEMVDAMKGSYHPPTYVVEDFPGLQWKSEGDNGIMFLAFTSGKIVITNGRNRDDIARGAVTMYDIIQDCRAKHPHSIQCM